MEYKIYKDAMESYRVYSDGTVIKNARPGARGYIRPERKLIPHKNNQGYDRVSISVNGKPKEVFVHRLVASLFCQNPNGYKIVDHIDGDKNNNNASNLEWVTSSENNKRAFKTGLKQPTVHYGEDHPMAKFTKADVRWIREHYIKGDPNYGQCGLARRFNTSQAHIYDIVNNRIWADV